MKIKLFITLTFCVLTFISNAQTEKGNFLLGGTIGYSTAKNKSGSYSDQRSSFYNISPKIGYFVANNFVIGTKLQYTLSKQEWKSNNYENESGGWMHSEERAQAYGISPFARYYISLTEMLKFYGEFEMSFEVAKSKKKDSKGEMTVNNKFNNYRPAISPGLVLFPSKKWAIEFSFPLLSYENRAFSKISGQDQKASTNSFDFGLNTFSPKLGVNYHF